MSTSSVAEARALLREQSKLEDNYQQESREPREGGGSNGAVNRNGVIVKPFKGGRGISEITTEEPNPEEVAKTAEKEENIKVLKNRFSDCFMRPRNCFLNLG